MYRFCSVIIGMLLVVWAADVRADQAVLSPKSDGSAICYISNGKVISGDNPDRTIIEGQWKETLRLSMQVPPKDRDAIFAEANKSGLTGKPLGVLTIKLFRQYLEEHKSKAEGKKIAHKDKPTTIIRLRKRSRWCRHSFGGWARRCHRHW